MNRLVTNSEYLELLEDVGYRDCSLWFSSAYDSLIKIDLLHAPLYWEKIGGAWLN